MRFYDTHTHLTDDAFAPDREAALARAAAAGVERLVTVGTDLASSRDALRLASERRGMLATAGIHPHEASCPEADWEALERIWRSGEVAAVGESGLDYHYDHAPRVTQCAVFERSVEAACRHRLPLVVHCREAHADLFAILEAAAADLARIGADAGVLHSFSGNEADLERALRLGFMISFSGVVTFRKADDARRAAACVPEERLLAETDCPYLAPSPHRGRRNEPAYVCRVAEKLAEIRGCPLPDLCGILWDNAVRLFGDGPDGRGSRSSAS